MDEFISTFPSECDYYGIKLPPNYIIEQCASLAEKYQFDLEKFFEQWLSFSLFSKIATDGNSPTRDNLLQFEKFILDSQKSLGQKKKDSIKLEKELDDNVELVSEKKRQRSEDEETHESKRPKENRNSSTIASSDPILDGASLPPQKTYATVGTNTKDDLASMCIDFNKRTDALRVLVDFANNEKLKNVATFKTENNDVKKVDITALVGGRKFGNLPSMCFDPPISKRTIISGKIDNYCRTILKQYNLGDPASFLSIPYKPESAIVYGQIVKNKQNKLTKDSIGLESSLSMGQGSVEYIDGSNLEKDTGVFPGQLVVVEASKGRMNRIGITQVYNDITPDLPSDLPDINFEEPLQVVIAAGPFSMIKNVDFEPLTALMAYIHEHRPHVLILIGPFLDKHHSRYITSETYDANFERTLQLLMKNLQADNLDTQVVVASSTNDIHHCRMYPTPPYKVKQTETPYPNLHLVPDPCVLDINGLKIGVTSQDILYHLSIQEMLLESTKNPDSKKRVNKMNRVVNYVLSQRSFYPLYPPDKSVPLNTRYWMQNCHFSETPHVMVLPSNLNYFVKEIKDCIVINPQKLIRMCSAGTFARFQLFPDDGTADKSIKDRIVCQILNI